MDISELLSKFERNDGHFARAAVEEAVARREEIIPELLGILEKVAENPSPFAEDKDYIALDYAMFLLAQFRETRAYPLLVRIFSYPGETPFDLVGDTVTVSLCNILASVSGGDISGMAALIENEEANEYVRSAALRGLVATVASGLRSRDEVMQYLMGLFARLERKYGYVWHALLRTCIALYPVEAEKEIRRVIDEDLTDEAPYVWEDVQTSIRPGKDAALQALHSGENRLITSTVKEMEWWACFDKDPRRKDLYRQWEREFLRSAGPQPALRTEPKIGRNDPCPCGSGRKYKKCCLASKAN